MTDRHISCQSLRRQSLPVDPGSFPPSNTKAAKTRNPGENIPTDPLPSHAPPAIQHALLNYLHWGGMPRVVLNEQDSVRETLLKRYFEDLLYKDVINRHNIRDVKTLRNIAVVKPATSSLRCSLFSFIFLLFKVLIPLTFMALFYIDCI